MTSCLTDDEILSLVQGRLVEAAQRLAHLDDCDKCRRLVALATPLDTGGEGTPRPHNVERPVGARVGDFVIVGLLGAGGMGVVHRARDERLGRPVALKLLARERSGDAQARARFEREARAAAALDHPNIGTVYEVGEHDGQPFIAMALYEGESLRARLARGPLDTDEIVSITRQLADATAAAHAAGIVHRDVKPANVMLLPDGTVKLLDFGVAKLTASDEASLTRDGAILGTPAYMAPEQLSASADVDERADLWSLGALLYEMLAGRPPFGRGPMPALVASIMKRPPPPLPASAPPDLAALALRLLEKSPAQRIGSAAEVSRLVARRAAPRWRPRRSVLIAGGCLVLLAVAAASMRPLLARVRHEERPVSANPKVVALYEQGMRDYHDGVDSASRHFIAALALDGECAAALLRLVEWDIEDGAMSSAIERYRAVIDHRERLSLRDRAVSDALEPILLRDPPDYRAAAQRLHALRDANPADLWLSLDAGVLSYAAGHKEDARRDLQRVVDADPGFGQAWRFLSYHARQQHQLTEARRLADQCLQRVPRSTSCVAERLQLESVIGECDNVIADARRWIAVDPDSELAYRYLADGLATTGGPNEAVDRAVEQEIRASGPWQDKLASGPVLNRASAAAIRGDFAAVDALASSYLAQNFPTSNFDSGLLLYRINAEAEAGDLASAARLAATQLHTFPANTVPEPDRLCVPTFLAWERKAGMISRAELRAQMEAWERDWHLHFQHDRDPELWVYGTAQVALTKEEAEAAIAVRPPLASLPTSLNAMEVGRVSLLAGRLDEAASLLEQYANECDVLFDPFDITISAFYLGQTRERQGRTAAACAAYARVLARWGHATPRSVTAEKARQASERLRCEEQ